ncbi:hypothetical protein bthur0009_53110 [Bacillus thuringiensis serovar andalousiensis BGSC 4AW1]|uniref:hypothetical protein n=2 Tax=Bacillus cereus group TaxID=86661 RepID=UPI0001A1D326|nr:hypothetical protein [Bacillus thuringiensis]EEM68668.1 hypothetical protein bthur0009_53110 [Bacillus thuringiensis serovar andalousiensis BGSC 4AW1]
MPQRYCDKWKEIKHITQGEHGEDHQMIHTPHLYTFPLEGVSQSAATLEDTEPINNDLSFCSMVHIPNGFVYNAEDSLQFITIISCKRNDSKNNYGGSLWTSGCDFESSQSRWKYLLYCGY